MGDPLLYFLSSQYALQFKKKLIFIKSIACIVYNFLNPFAQT